MPTSKNRKNIVQPADWWRAFQAAADSAGMDLSAWIGQACRSALPKKVSDKLSERRKGRPKSADSVTTSGNPQK